MSTERRLLAGALGLVLVVAACGGSSTPTPGTTATPGGSTPGASAQPTQAAATEEPTETETPTETADATDGIEPSLAPGAASDLEALLPSEAGGVKFDKTSFDGASLGLAGAGVDTAELAPILAKYGKTANDVRFAMATPSAGGGTETAMVFAFQVRGVPAAEFISAMGVSASDMTPAKVGGKDVLQAGAGGMGVIIYTKDDVLFEVLLASDTVAAAIVQQLP